MADTQLQPGTVDVEQREKTLIVRLRGSFTLRSSCAICDEAVAAIKNHDAESLLYESDQLLNWDSSLVSLLFEIEREATGAEMKSDRSGLPPHLRTLLEIALSGRETDARTPVKLPGFIENLGLISISAWRDFLEFVEFSGELSLSLLRLLRGESRMRWRDFWYLLQTVSVNALPIVLLISFLVGLIIAFLGAVVLVRFGAEFAIAYLVGYGILREMGAVMTGIIMAGRTGAAFAAQIGSMKVSEELDALKTLGISPMDFLVLPRVISLVLMMPLLTVFADVVGIFGGYLVAVGMLDVPSTQFISNIDFVVSLNDLLLGVFKGGVFGVLIAVSGCLRGIQCGRSADAVGVAATRAVVLAITLIIFSNAIIDWLAAHLKV